MSENSVLKQKEKANIKYLFDHGLVYMWFFFRNKAAPSVLGGTGSHTRLEEPNTLEMVSQLNSVYNLSISKYL